MEHTERFWSKVKQGSREECWPWQAGTIPSGYGAFDVRLTGHGGAHVVAYELSIGPVPPGHGTHVHHLCGNRLCCNPAHLFLLAAEVHGLLHSPHESHCGRGHEFTPENTYEWRNKRICRTCARERGDQWAQANPERMRELQRQYHERQRDAKRKAGIYRPPPGERTHCPKGHPYSGENLTFNPTNGSRQCRACIRERDRKRARTAERKAQAKAAMEKHMQDPEYAAAKRAYKAAWAARKRAEDPEFAERQRTAAREYQRRKRAERTSR